MARALVGKRCKVAWIELSGTAGRGKARVGYRCERDGRLETGQYTYPHKGGGFSNYPTKTVRARSVRFRGMTVTGQARVDFVLSPASAVCRKDGHEISCRLVGDKSLPSLEGLRFKRRRR